MEIYIVANNEAIPGLPPAEAFTYPITIQRTDQYGKRILDVIPDPKCIGLNLVDRIEGDPGLLRINIICNMISNPLQLFNIILHPGYPTNPDIVIGPNVWVRLLCLEKEVTPNS